MTKFVQILIVFMLIISCFTSNITNTLKNVNDTSKVKTVTIKSGSNYTVHKVNTYNLITNSSYVDSRGVAYTKVYNYDDTRALTTVVKTNAVTGSETMNISTSSTRGTDNKVTKKVKSISDTRGSYSVLTVDYFYDNSGDAIGMIQTDAYGNIIAKGINN